MFGLQNLNGKFFKTHIERIRRKISTQKRFTEKTTLLHTSRIPRVCPGQTVGDWNAQSSLVLATTEMEDVHGPIHIREGAERCLYFQLFLKANKAR